MYVYINYKVCANYTDETKEDLKKLLTRLEEETEVKWPTAGKPTEFVPSDDCYFLRYNKNRRCLCYSSTPPALCIWSDIDFQGTTGFDEFINYINTAMDAEQEEDFEDDDAEDQPIRKIKLSTSSNNYDRWNADWLGIGPYTRSV